MNINTKFNINATLINTNGEEREITPINGKNFTLQELYKLIDCTTIEVLPLPNRKYMIIDEEGKLKLRYTLNGKATQIYKLDFIVGNVVICDRGMFK